jgi:hypothetical protein
MLEGGIAEQVHVARVPLVAERGHRLGARVDEESELRIFVPGGDLVSLKRFSAEDIGPPAY